jgi:ABC-type Fe3+ transport system permease subunit
MMHLISGPRARKALKVAACALAASILFPPWLRPVREATYAGCGRGFVFSPPESNCFVHAAGQGVEIAAIAVCTAVVLALLAAE